jgi:hypothetical protein
MNLREWDDQELNSRYRGENDAELDKNHVRARPITGTASMSARAADVWHISTIKYVYPQGDGSFVLIFETNAPACSNPNAFKYHHVTPTQNGVNKEGAKKIYAAALMAKAAALPVQINFSDSTISCYINRLTVL